ncbi:MAG: hypothetical protein IKO23_09595 [Bacteroidales bacterium]|nr:hypothetical protein [Bacteroidales bacterium]
MNVSITKEEFLAICFAIYGIESYLIYMEKYFGPSDEEFAKYKEQGDKSIQAMRRIREKYEETLFSEKMIAGLIAESKKQGKKMTSKEARKILRKYKVI